jgi:hypothetical protein
VVALVRKGGHLGVVKDYLLAVQKNNLVAVNEAVNELHISEDDYEALDTSVGGYDNFDQLKLAEELEACFVSPERTGWHARSPALHTRRVRRHVVCNASRCMPRICGCMPHMRALSVARLCRSTS